jgi:glyoxylase-like metal-dependent hydrolase (beta-lactamase superfamily II)
LGYCTVTLFELDGKGWGLFDTGHYSDRHCLLTALDATGIKPEDIRVVVLSHLHFDHILNLPLFPGVEVYVSKAEIEYARQVSARKRVDHSVPDFWPTLIDGHVLHQVEDTYELDRRYTLACYPGHTPGGVVVLCQGLETTAVCGDVIKNAWEAVKGESTMAVSADDAATSIRALMTQAQVIVPGHDRPFRHFQGEIKYLEHFSWEIRTSLYPEPVNKSELLIERD